MRLFEVVGEIAYDMFQDVVDVVRNNLYNVYKLIMFACPYVMLYIGVSIGNEGILAGWVVLLIPVLLWLISSFLHRLANKNNRGDSVPVPRKRFTEIEEEMDGYTINQDDINEIILYLGEVEDYLERKRLL